MMMHGLANYKLAEIITNKKVAKNEKSNADPKFAVFLF
jgi:hypothetical protein